MNTIKSIDGYFGRFGGSFIPEILHNSQQQLLTSYHEAMGDDLFIAGVRKELSEISDRPTPLGFCENLSREIGGTRIYLKT